MFYFVFWLKNLNIFIKHSNKANNTEIWLEINVQRLEDGCFRTTSTWVNMVKISPRGSSGGGSIFSRGNWARACAATWNLEDYWGWPSISFCWNLSVDIDFQLGCFWVHINARADGHVLAGRRRGSEWIIVHFFCIDIL